MLEKMEFNILNTEEKIETLQVKLQELKKKKQEYENSQKLKLLSQNNIDLKQLQDVLNLLNSQMNQNEETTEKENNFEND